MDGFATANTVLACSATCCNSPSLNEQVTRLVVTEVWSGSFRLVTECCHNIGVLSVIFLPTGQRPMCDHSYCWLLDVLHCNTCHIFHHPVWYSALSLRYVCIRHSGIILTLRLPLRKISFLSHPPIAELARGEKLRTKWVNHSLSQSLTQLIWCPENRSFCFGNSCYITHL